MAMETEFREIDESGNWSAIYQVGLHSTAETEMNWGRTVGWEED